jgi:hypothetical protein
MEQKVLAFARMTLQCFRMKEILTFVRIMVTTKKAFSMYQLKLLIRLQFRRRPESPLNTQRFVILAKARTSFVINT